MQKKQTYNQKPALSRHKLTHTLSIKSTSTLVQSKPTNNNIFVPLNINEKVVQACELSLDKHDD